MKKKKIKIASPNSQYFIVADRDDHGKVMHERQRTLRALCKNSKAETLAHELIRSSTTMKVTRQAQWGNRFYDFWFHDKAIAIEIDGREHIANFDEMRDRYNYIRSAILVFRAKNFDSERLAAIMAMVNAAKGVSYRKELLGIGSGDSLGCTEDLLFKPMEAAIAWERVRYLLDPTRAGTLQPPMKMSDGSTFFVSDLSCIL